MTLSLLWKKSLCGAKFYTGFTTCRKSRKNGTKYLC